MFRIIKKSLIILIFVLVLKDRLEGVKIKNVGSAKYLKYVKTTNRKSGFRLDLVNRKDEADDFKVEIVKIFISVGKRKVTLKNLKQELFGSLGEYYVLNIKTPDDKYLIFKDNLLKVVKKIPMPDLTEYTWLAFYHIKLGEYFFYPVFNQTLYLQKKRIEDEAEVLPFTGQAFIYWKIED